VYDVCDLTYSQVWYECLMCAHLLNFLQAVHQHCVHMYIYIFVRTYIYTVSDIQYMICVYIYTYSYIHTYIYVTCYICPVYIYTYGVYDA